MLWGILILRATLNFFGKFFPGATFIPESRVPSLEIPMRQNKIQLDKRSF